jgi:hypothetical protein
MSSLLEEALRLLDVDSPDVLGMLAFCIWGCDAMLKMSSLSNVAVVRVEVAGKSRGDSGGGALKTQEAPENYLHHAELMGNCLYGGGGWSAGGEVNNPGLVPALRH